MQTGAVPSAPVSLKKSLSEIKNVTVACWDVPWLADNEAGDVVMIQKPPEM